MKKFFLIFVFPAFFAVIYGATIVFSYSQPETERGVGLLFAFILSFPSSLIVAEFNQSTSYLGFALEGLVGILQYLLFGFFIDLIRLRVNKIKSVNDETFNQMKSYL